MAQAKVAMSLRLASNLYEKLNKFAEKKGESMTSVLNDAIDYYLESQKEVEIHNTKHEDYWIRTTKSAACDAYDEITLGSAYAGSEHVTFHNISVEDFQAVFDLLENTIDFIESNTL